MRKNITHDKAVLSQSEQMERRRFLRFSVIAGGSFLLALITPLSACGWRARARRRVRRRTRRRVRRRVAWRTVAGRRVLVIPTNIQTGDELVLDDGRTGTVTAVHADSIVVNINGTEETVPAVFEGEI